jgi:hypothetical protein
MRYVLMALVLQVDSLEALRTKWAAADEAGRVKLRPVCLAASKVPPGYKPVANATAPVGWEPFAVVQGSHVETKFARTGKRAGRLMPHPAENKAGNGWITSQRFKVQEGKGYTLTAWCLSNGADAPAKLAVRWYGTDGEALGTVGPVTVDGDLPLWTKYTATGVAPAGASWADVCLWGTHTVGAIWIDDVSVTCGGAECLRNGGFE